MKTCHRPKKVLEKYLADYAQDRNLLSTTIHKAVVDRLYHTDPRITSWTAHWDELRGQPYLARKGKVFIAPEGLVKDSVQGT